MRKNVYYFIVPLIIMALMFCSCVIPWDRYYGIYFGSGAGERRPFDGRDRYYPLFICVKEQYHKLHIKEMSYEWEGNTGILLKEKDYILSPQNYWYDSKTGEHVYWIDKLLDIDVKGLFRGKKSGDKFEYTVKTVYSFDDGPENTQFLKYNVTVQMGKFHAAFMWGLTNIFAIGIPK